MRNVWQLIMVALLSTGFTLVLSRWLFPPVQVVWSGSTAEAQYTSLVDKIWSARGSAGYGSAAPTQFTDAAQVATPAVVNIRSVQEVNGSFFRSGSFSGATGSGVVVSPDGYIVTNHHVVERGVEIKVTLSNKKEYKAELVGSDPSTDIALLKIDAAGLPFLLFGNSDSTRVGEWVLAVGNPFNLTSTVTAGIISAKGRNINILGGGGTIESFIQTDAAVNSGNSGGALVNSLGELIGVNTAIITQSGNYEGYSFAVPSNLVQKVVRDLRDFGSVQRAYLGVGIEDVSNEVAEELGLPDAFGVLVNRVSAQGAAADAGLSVGDVILSINGIATQTTPELQELVGRLRPGEDVRLDYWRKGQRKQLMLTLKDAANSFNLSRYKGDELLEELGIELRNLTSTEQKKWGFTGVSVSSVRRGSRVYDTNMQPGFILSRVNGNRVSNIGEAIEAIRLANNSLVLDGYYQGEDDLYSYRLRKR
jgi:serine protease Do